MKETAAFYKKARKFYDALARQLVRQGHALDIFACSLDQVLGRGPRNGFLLRAAGLELKPCRAALCSHACVWAYGVMFLRCQGVVLPVSNHVHSSSQYPPCR